MHQSIVTNFYLIFSELKTSCIKEHTVCWAFQSDFPFDAFCEEE